MPYDRLFSTRQRGGQWDALMEYQLKSGFSVFSNRALIMYFSNWKEDCSEGSSDDRETDRGRVGQGEMGHSSSKADKE